MNYRKWVLSTVQRRFLIVRWLFSVVATISSLWGISIHRACRCQISLKRRQNQNVCVCVCVIAEKHCKIKSGLTLQTCTILFFFFNKVRQYNSWRHKKRIMKGQCVALLQAPVYPDSWRWMQFLHPKHACCLVCKCSPLITQSDFQEPRLCLIMSPKTDDASASEPNFFLQKIDFKLQLSWAAEL